MLAPLAEISGEARDHPAFKQLFTPRGVLDYKATDTDDTTVSVSSSPSDTAI
jgi:hypothetical protein